MKKAGILSLILSLAFFTITGCSSQSAPSGGTAADTGNAAGSAAADAATEVIKIGGIGPLTPPGSPVLGQEMQQAMELAVDEINQKGGVLGKKLQLFYEDSAGSPEKGQSAMEKLTKKEQVVAVAGEGHSSAALAEMEVAKRENIPFIVAEAWSDTITEKGYKQVFRIAPNNSMFSKRIVEFVEFAGFRQVAILAEDSDWGIGNVDLLKKQLTEKGITFKSVIVDRNTKDFVPQLLELKKGFEPDIILNIMTGVGSYLVVKQAHELGISPSAKTAMLMGGADAAYPEIWENTGEAAKYVIWQAPYHPKAKFTDLTQPMVKAFEEKFGRKPTYAALHAYDCILLLADAITRAGSIESDKIIQALEETSLTGTRGTISFPLESGVDYHNWLPALLFVQYTQENQDPDDAEILFPKDVATAEYLKPEK
ncbi:ABC transporter substrate-binding protein [Brevibacillus massiliensis]|jgi:branched-chain amino acid transport system substrate-binding protein|uniref:ABC transporter substrate-binding protein n=1 Tax=Brevibacillus massiliensis TaxID=1118054 RepID=UPI0002FD9AD6|nr:ABC transporter substrate-binding protein [Brevibacillus massiliensis]